MLRSIEDFFDAWNEWSTQKKMLVVIAALTAVMLAFVVACDNSGQEPQLPTTVQNQATQKPRPAPTPRPRSTSTPTPGEMISVIDGEYGNTTYAKRGDYLTNSIARWCSDSASPEDVGDLATVTSNVLRDQFGIEVGVLEILEEVKDATDETESETFECRDFFVMYTLLKGQ